MAESSVQVTEGVGKKLHTWNRTVTGPGSVEDEFTLPGEYPLPSFFALAPAVSIATANDHILCLNAAASVLLKIRRIRIEQSGNATTAGVGSMQLLRTTTAAPTGGTAVTPAPFDTADTASAAARTLPTVKATESTLLMQIAMVWRQAISATGAQVDDAWEWTQLPGQKPIIVPAGTTSGLVLKNLAATAAATVNVIFEFVEMAF
jgi:hypothetical protein